MVIGDFNPKTRKECVFGPRPDQHPITVTVYVSQEGGLWVFQTLSALSGQAWHPHTTLQVRAVGTVRGTDNL